MIYLLLDEADGRFLGVVSQNVPWGPAPGIQEIAFPEGYALRRLGLSWEVWAEHPHPPPLGEAVLRVLAAHAIPLTIPPAPPPLPPPPTPPSDEEGDV